MMPARSNATLRAVSTAPDFFATVKVVEDQLVFERETGAPVHAFLRGPFFSWVRRNERPRQLLKLINDTIRDHDGWSDNEIRSLLANRCNEIVVDLIAATLGECEKLSLLRDIVNERSSNSIQDIENKFSNDNEVHMYYHDLLTRERNIIEAIQKIKYCDRSDKSQNVIEFINDFYGDEHRNGTLTLEYIRREDTSLHNALKNYAKKHSVSILTLVAQGQHHRGGRKPAPPVSFDGLDPNDPRDALVIAMLKRRASERARGARFRQKKSALHPN